MKKRLFKGFSLITILALMLAAVPIQGALAATSIAQWTFESPNTPADATGATYPNAIAPAVGSGNAGGVHASAATQWTTPAGNGTTDSLSSNNWGIGDYYQFSTSTLNFTGIQVSWDQTRSSTGPGSFKLAYSTDGTNFTDFNTYTVNAVTWSSTTAASGSSFSFDLSAVTALNNQANVYFRLITTVAGAAAGSNRVDNFVVSGTAAADAAPSVLSTTPTNGATNVAVNTNITVNFSEAVDALAGAITVECPAGTVVASNTVVDNLASVVIDPASDLPFGTTCAINVSAGGVTDEDTNDPPDGMAANFNAAFTTATPPSTSTVVISQIYGGAGCGTAGCSTYTNDYIELYNRSANTVNITGWSVQYASATGTSWQTTALSGSIAPGQYYLVQEGGNANGVNPLPTPNATGGINMSATVAKVALVSSTTALSGSGCPIASPIVDFVGYGTTADCFEGSGRAPAPSTTTAIFRAGNGSTDTDNNSADFAVGTPNPRNTPPPNPDLTISDVSLAEGNSGTTTFAFTVSLSGPAPAGGVTFDIATSDGTATLADNDYQSNSVTGQPISAGGTTFTFNVLVNGDTTDEGADETFFVTVSNVSGANLVDGQGQGTIVNDDVNVCAQTFTPIYNIQGSGSSAATTGNVTTKGVVVGDFEGTAAASGFYMQDLTGDGDASTSDGIFVYTGSSNLVNLGDVVRVTGFARERFNQTTINGSNSDSAAVTAPNVVNCGTGSVPATDVTLPFASSTFPERYEGMYVRLPQSLVIAEYFNYDRFGEIVLALPLAGESRPFTGTAIDEPGAAANARTLANSLSRITLDDAQSAQNPPVLRHPNGSPFSLSNLFRGGDTVQNTVGVLGFDFSLYRVIPTGPADYTAVNPRPASPESVGGSLRVAAMNTLNFFVTLDTTASDTGPGPCGANQNLDCRGADASEPLEFTRQRDKLLTALNGLNADIIGLNELESTPGAEPLDSIVAGMPGYDYIHTGPIGTDAIKVGIIYRPSVVTPVGTYKLLTTAVDPRFIDTKSRPSLAQTFMVNATGAKFTVVVNHFKSKGSACDDVGDPDLLDGQGNCSQTRRAAAEALVDWLAGDPTGSGDPDFLIVGDLNSYAMEDSIDEIKAGSDDTVGTSDDYTNLIAHFHGAYAYSYTFDGQAGYLDHALANAALFSQVTGAADWHINSDEPDILDYDTSFKPPAQEALYEVNPYRTSDHDAVVIGLNLTPPPDTVAPDTAIDSNPSNPSNSSSASFTFSGTDAGGSGVASFECKLDAGSFGACTSPQSYSGLADGSHTFQVRAIDGANNVDATPASFTWTVDTTAPDTTINSNPSNPSSSSSASFTFSGTDAGTGVVSFECKLDGGSFAACTSPQAYSGLADGSHTFQVRAIDGVNNVDATPASFTWSIDATAPTVTIDQAAGQSDPTGISPINFTVVFSESVTGFSNSDVTLSGTAGATTAVVTGGPTTYNVAVSGMTSNGTVIASIPAGAASDSLGNSSTASTSTDNTVTYSNSAPTIAVATGGMCTASGGGVNITVSDAEGNPLTLSGSSSNTSVVPNGNITFSGSGSSRTVNVTANAASTIRTTVLTITVSDGISTASTTITVVVGTSGNNPTINGTSGADLILGLDGNDTINGLGGNDVLCGGAKNDTLNGGADNDTLFGEQGNDILTGSTGADFFSGGAGNDNNTDFNAGQGDTNDGS